MKVTVYSKPQCVQCDRTEKLLKASGVDFEKIDVTLPENAAHLERLKAWGYMSAPVVALPGMATVLDAPDQAGNRAEVSIWFGLRPDLLDQIPEALKKAGCK